ncbi:NUDIX hydrolase [Kineobactrum sediminis]|uniref:NUDIX hydrolase n=1 Tax=Kineobactrum sediminis TaxID=1905677 RepID=A0A2N5Y635_9GAMM|nr:NUDIX hydrolase [Kineobactrum sediminis]PLW83857.1 NUDIX hydrolase [Kineobactrum sediminis]
MNKTLRPRDAATLIIIRDGRELLLGSRSSAHRFLPHHYVFPGGRVDPGDARVACPHPLEAQVEARLRRSVTTARARALAMAAVRETFEETGLILGTPVAGASRSRSPGWRPFLARGYMPALHHLNYVARAVTPPNPVARFDARFFLVDARHLHGELQSNGELEDLRWVPLDEIDHLPLIGITRLVVELLRQRLEQPDASPEQIPLYRELWGKELLEHH